MEDSLKITIAIDGFSSCGKSTLARDLADKLGYLHVDSGAMYRAVTLHLMREQIDIQDHRLVEEATRDLRISFLRSGDTSITVLNGEDVELAIRTLEVNALVSPVSAISAVRRLLVEQQRNLGKGGGVIMDGRDIGTVVFPEAELKLFLTASLDVRIERRYSELLQKGMTVTREDVMKSITERDEIDSTREDSPLRRARDAVILDNTDMTREEQLAYAYAHALTRLSEVRKD